MDDLVAWLRAQLDEDERVAKAATPGTWTVRKPASVETDSVTDDNRGHVVYSVGMYNRGWPSDDDAEHIARHDRARVLREVETKRRIIDGCLGTLEKEDSWDPQLDGGSGEEFDLARWTIQLLTLPYSDRPGYRDEWKP